MREGIILAAAGIGVMLLHGVVHTALVRVFGLAHKEPAGISELTGYAMRHGGGDLATFGVLVGAYLLFEANRRARARELAAAELATRLASADLELLRWHLHPHFLFNALNTVSTLVLKGETEAASSAITMISRYLRAGIAQRADSLVPLGDDIEMVRRYVDIETLRFGDSLRVEIHADEAALDTPIPGSLLQPVVENAITHGSVREPGSDPIRITATTGNARLKLTVSNPSSGERRADTAGDPEAPDSGRFGLRYVRERLRQFYGDRATFDLSRSGSVMVASFDLPAK
jgi:LytS/YehU family sensor histidine kinase